jgi:hypothetical protein
MDFLHIRPKGSDSVRDTDANFGMSMPRKDDWLQIGNKRYTVTQIVRRLQKDDDSGLMIQYDRHVWAEEI